MEHIFRAADRVEHYLKHYPPLRDDDNRLVANIWADELKHKGMSQRDCLYAVSKGVLTASDSITRSRRKLQEHNPKYRGNKWESRQRRGNHIRKTIKDFEV